MSKALVIAMIRYSHNSQYAHHDNESAHANTNPTETAQLAVDTRQRTRRMWARCLRIACHLDMAFTSFRAAMNLRNPSPNHVCNTQH